MSIGKSPFIVGGGIQETPKAGRRGQKSDDTGFRQIVEHSQEGISKSENGNEKTSGQTIARLFANGLAMGEAQHQQNNTVIQSVLPQQQQVVLPQQQQAVVTQQGIPLHKNSSGIEIEQRGKGIALDTQRDSIFSAHAIALNRKSKKIEAATKDLGALSAQFESGKQGSAAIGYDQVGGTSYGKYQIASKPGSMDEFIAFLEREAPDMAKRLKEAGPANTGSRQGSMPDVWKSLAAENPDRFGSLQDKFIIDQYYKPAMDGIKTAGFNIDDVSLAVKEVIWSTAVQHGASGAVRIFEQAAQHAGVDSGTNIGKKEEKLIEQIYAVRGNQFGSSSRSIQSAVQERMQSEKNIALAMLQQSKGTLA